jgi:hypothetical protein
LLLFFAFALALAYATMIALPSFPLTSWAFVNKEVTLLLSFDLKLQSSLSVHLFIAHLVVVTPLPFTLFSQLNTWNEIR